MTTKTVAVIGAGLAGLVTLKSCLEEGLDATIYEQSDHIGGNWKFQEEGVSVFRHTELTSSKYLTAFSDFPMPEDYPHFMRHEQYFEYLQAYTEQFGLWNHIQLGVTVDAVERQGHQWAVTLGQAQQRSMHIFDAIAVCTGLNEKWEFPNIDNIASFRGNLIHSSAYKDSTPFRDQRVVVVGGGESGGDIINELSQVATDVTLSLRRGVFVMPKLDRRMTLPGDYFHHRVTYHLPPALYDGIETLIQTLLTVLNSYQRPWRIRQQLINQSGGSYHQQFLTKSDVFLKALAHPNVQLKPGLQSFTPQGVRFTDGSLVAADSVIFCSGFKVTFPFLPISSQGWDWRKLYKKIFHPDLPNIGFVGFARPNIGAMPPVTELQARYFAGIASGRLSLPDPSKMQQTIQADAETTAKLKPLVCDRVTGIVSFVPYMYDLAGLIGCRPVLKHLLARPVVLWSVLFGTVASTHFRIAGPHANPAMLDVIEQEGLHLRKLTTLSEWLLFILLQLIWGGTALIGYPVFKAMSYLSRLKAWKPELTF